MNTLLEKTLHLEIAKVLQRFEVEHGIRVDRVEASWIDASTVANDRFVLRSIEVQTRTGHR